jgi:hypothetical protein
MPPVAIPKLAGKLGILSYPASHALALHVRWRGSMHRLIVISDA